MSDIRGERLYRQLTLGGLVLSIYRPGGPVSGPLGPAHVYLDKGDVEGIFWMGSIRRRCQGGPWEFGSISPENIVLRVGTSFYSAPWFRERLEGGRRVFYSDLLERMRTHEAIADILEGVRVSAFAMLL